MKNHYSLLSKAIFLLFLSSGFILITAQQITTTKNSVKSATLKQQEKSIAAKKIAIENKKRLLKNGTVEGSVMQAEDKTENGSAPENNSRVAQVSFQILNRSTEDKNIPAENVSEKK